MNTKKHFEGVYSLGKNGIAYIKNKVTGIVIEIPTHHHGSALHKDIVRVHITNEKTNEGKIINIIKRFQSGFVGILKRKGNHYIVSPDNLKIPDIIIPKNVTHDANVGEKVFAIITKYEPHLVGQVTENFENLEPNDAHMHGILLEQGFHYAFPKKVEQEAERIEQRGIQEEDKIHRRDMRDTLTFTIDPSDAKDFDDALSFKKLSNGNYEIGIHIADVSYYVRPGSVLDQEAQKRATSVYLVDRTISMLPEKLSNGLCSLGPDEEKLCFSVIFEIEPSSAKILNKWFGRSLIKSNKRFTYEEAQEIIDTKNGLYLQELLEFNRLAKIYTKQRYNKGALNFETHEVKFILDEKGVPINVKIKERIDTNKLIEEFMLLANNKVAEYMKESQFFVYRVHDKPEQDRMEKLQSFLKLLDYKVELENGIIPVSKLQSIIKESEGTTFYETLQTVIVRSMQKAVYTTNNIGHFGLAFDNYSHFTSPIRRYPDILAHRLLEYKFTQTPTDHNQEWYEKMCHHSSEQENKAVIAERNSIKLKQVEYMKTKDHEEIFEGIVTGAGKFGVFVAEMKSRSEGMIRLFDLGNDMWEYKEKSGVIIGKKTKKTFKIGDTVHLQIKNINLEKRLIDYVLVINGIPQTAPPKKRKVRGGNTKRINNSIQK